ncbi:hypothetical protein AB395_00004246 (plasmid) [Sinorhizobium fredii CCBAU 45436]|nr:hypothetical protein AB395_00004246 [Sinorhizobium fredii CCBAU 45436]
MSPQPDSRPRQLSLHQSADNFTVPADAHLHEVFGSASFELPGQEMSGPPQERVDARPSKATLLAKPGFVFVADRKPQSVGGAGCFWSRWPLMLHKPQQSVNTRLRNFVPALAGISTAALPE